MTETPPGYQPGMDPKAAAKAAKAYAKATRPWYKKKRFIIPLALVALIVISSALSGGGDPSPSNDDTASTSNDTAADDTATDAKQTEKATTKPKKKVATVKVDAATLIKEFSDNELAADTKYKGKNIQVSGTVEKIDTELWDDDKYILQISGGGDFEFFTVNCSGMSNEELATLTVGDDVTAVGKFDDGGDLGVDLKKCSLK